MTRNFDFARGQQFIDAIRSSGYKNAAMAVGELVDNSIQAGAENVDILVTEKRVTPSERTVRRIQEIGVLDDGKGMDSELLRRALKLGDGTHFNDQKGIGKFGVGLPQSSVSQAKRVDVWTWQNGIENAIHSFIDLTDEEWVEDMVIPEPTEKAIPDKWMQMSEFDDQSGTLVIWSKVDRCTWKKASTLFKHSQALIGRMYRNWLHDSDEYPNANISLVLFDEDHDLVEKEWNFEPNDPLYLMANTTVELPDECPDPPFEQNGDPVEKVYRITQPDGTVTEETVEITSSISKPEARKRVDGNYAGAAPHGQHAKNNIGLSIVREGRELNLDKSWASKDPRHRWWGAQVEFGRNMDDIFGVTNNKQRADRLSGVANKSWEDFGEPGESEQQIRKRLKDEDFPTFVCLDVKHEIEKRISLLDDKVKEMGEYTNKSSDKKEKRHEDTPEKHGTEATKSRQDTGEEGESDKDEELSEEEKKEEIETRLRDQGLDEETIQEVTGEVVDHGLKFSFVEKHLTGSEIFSVEPTAGAILIGLNKDHLAYRELFSTLNLESEEELAEEDAVEKLQAANKALKLLLEAWARLEDESSGDQKYLYKDLRNDWGRVARDFLEISLPEEERE